MILLFSDWWASLLGVSVALVALAAQGCFHAHFIFKCANQACDPQGAFL